MRSPRISIASGLLAALTALPGQAADETPTPSVRVGEPRAFGYRVGDVVARELHVELPAGRQLDEASLPAPGRQSHALELRSISRAEESIAGGARRLTLRLEYQLFAAPALSRSYELPALRLRFEGAAAAAEELRIDTWPVVIAPLAPESGITRRGLGELRPDHGPPLRGTRFERIVVTVAAGVALLLAGWLVAVYVGLPWWSRQHRPFSRAYRLLRARRGGAGEADNREAWRVLHAAFDRTAGHAVFADSIDGFLSEAPRFQTLRDDIRMFFERSQLGFFAGQVDAAPEQDDWLLAFARACRDAERGLAV